MDNIFISSRLSRLSNDLVNILESFNVNMSVDSDHPRANKKMCSCVHHKPPADAKPKSPRCGKCFRRKSRTQQKHAERDKIPEKTAGGHADGPVEDAGANADDAGAAAEVQEFQRIELDDLQKELMEEKNKVEELEKSLRILQGESEEMKRSKESLLEQVAALQERISQCTAENKLLSCQCDTLKGELKLFGEREEKRTSEIGDEVQKIENIMKDKENSLIDKINELNKRISELTNTVKQQKKEISELTSTCTKQKLKIEESDRILSSKTSELVETGKKLRSKCCQCKNLQDEVENIKKCLNDESKAADDFKKELDACKDNCKCQLLIKDKIIEDQNETIKKLKNLLHESEKIVHQATREHEMLSDELFSERQENNELKIIIGELEENYQIQESKRCEKCETLEGRLNCLQEQKQKAVTAAKYAAKRLRETTDEYQTQICTEKQQYRYLMTIVKEKDEEIKCLKSEINYMRSYK